jgi:hypothetical protein
MTAAALCCAALLAAGCAAGQPARPARPASPAPALATGAERQALAARYLAIALPANRRLEIDFDRLDGRDRGNLAAAQDDLRQAASTEHLFDRRLLAIAFPSATEAQVRFLVWVNESRATLTTTAAASTSLRQLARYEPQLVTANRPVEQGVTAIRSQLGLPPPDTS